MKNKNHKNKAANKIERKKRELKWKRVVETLMMQRNVFFFHKGVSGF